MASGLFAGIGGAIVKGAIGGSLGRIAFGALGSFIGNTFLAKIRMCPVRAENIRN